VYHLVASARRQLRQLAQLLLVLPWVLVQLLHRHQLLRHPSLPFHLRVARVPLPLLLHQRCQI
jgi:hypothetical protein